jgi:hypothetical protein
MRCTYSYTETKIVTTPTGEEEEIIEHSELILLDEDGDQFSEECIKKKESDAGTEFTIEEYYKLESETTELDNFEYQCTES